MNATGNMCEVEFPNIYTLSDIIYYILLLIIIIVLTKYTLIRLQKILSIEEKKILIISYFMANFNYCAIVWRFSSTVSLKKIENLQK